MVGSIFRTRSAGTLSQACKYHRALRVSRKLLPYTYMAPSMAWILFFMVYPLIFSIVMAFKRFKLQRGVSFWQMPWVGVENFVEAFHDKFFLQSLRTTFIILVIGVSVEFLVGLAIALLLNRECIKHDYVWVALILSPLMMPLVATGNLWRMLLDQRWGAVNAMLMFLGIKPINFLGDPFWALVAVIIVDIWQWTPFVAIILLSGLRSIPREPYEAALVDGASGWQVFRFITWPLMLWQVLIVLLIRGMDVFKTFDIVYALTFGGPGQSTTTVSFYIYRQAFTQFKLGYGTALSWIVFIIVYLITYLLLRFVQPREVTA